MNGKGMRHAVSLARCRLHAAQVALIVVALTLAIWPAQLPAWHGDAATLEVAGARLSLAELLNTEGRLDLASGHRSIIGARSWQLMGEPNVASASAPLLAAEGQWSGIFHPPGMDSVVRALVFDGAGNLYAGGAFTRAVGVAANRIAKWDGSAWSALGSGMNDQVLDLAVDSAGNLYAAGLFTTAGGAEANRIAKWDGNAWSALGSGVDHYGVYALAVDGADNLYAGGEFWTAGGVMANQIAKWDGSAWTALGSGMDGPVLDLAVDSAGNLYAGGGFSAAGNVAANGVAKWDGAVWSALGTGMNGGVKALVIDGTGNLYAAGGGAIAKWDGSNWQALDPLLPGGSPTFALAVDNDGKVYAGGEQLGTNSFVSMWDGASWSRLGSEMNDRVRVLAMDRANNLYAGGSFTINANGIPSPSIAKWDGSGWSALGSGMDGAVVALALDDAGNLYAGGHFWNAGGVMADYIAKWDGTAWSALGTGLNGKVSALAIDDTGDLYAGGEFTLAGSVPVNNVARWDGSAWSALGSGINGVVSDLVVDGAGVLYAGGSFNVAGGVAASAVAKWNGTGWSTIGNGIVAGPYNGRVVALAVDGSGNLYVGGRFPTAGSAVVGNIAKWNGTAWSALGSGVSGTNDPHVSAILIDDAGDLYAGGEFATAGGAAANYIAKWDGSVWSALDIGMNGDVLALALDGFGDLYVGGLFTSAGGTPSAHIGAWEKPGQKLLVATVGKGSGTATSSPQGIDCGTDCRERFPTDAVVSVAAHADASSKLTGWSGACTGADACVVTMDAAKVVTATFDLKTYVAALSKAGNGNGTVTLTPPGITCGLACNEITSTLEHGTVVTLTAAATTGSLFAGWNGACSGALPCAVTMNGAKRITATFVLETDRVFLPLIGR